MADFPELAVNDPSTAEYYGSDTLAELFKLINGKTVTGRLVKLLTARIDGPLEFKVQTGAVSAPATQDHINLYVDSTTKRLTAIKSGGSIVELENQLVQALNTLTDTAISSPANNDTIRYNSSTGKWYNTPAGSAGEANTVTNIGTAGIGVYKQKTGVNFELKKLVAGSTKVTITDNTGNNTIDIDAPGSGETNTYSNAGTGGIGVTLTKSGVDLPFKSIKANSNKIAVTDGGGNNNVLIDVTEANLALANISGTLAVNKGGTGKTSITSNALLKGAGTSAPTEIAPGTNSHVLTMVAGVPAWAAAPSATGGFVLPDGTSTTKPRVGVFYGGGADGSMMLSGLTINGVQQPGAVTATDFFSIFKSDIVDAALGGVSTALPIVRRDHNPTVKFRWYDVQSSERHWCGITTESPQDTNTDTHMDDESGAGVSFSDNVNNFTIQYNNSSASQTTLDTGVAKNTSAHTLEISLDNVTPRMIIKFDGTERVNTTTMLPAATDNMYIHCNQESIGTTGPSVAISYIYIISD